MKKAKVLVALILIFTMVFAVALTGCGNNDKPEEGTEEGQEEGGEEEGEEEAEGEAPAARDDGILVVGYTNFNSKFSPFFSDSAYDTDVYSMTQIGLLSSDRQGAIVEKGINGEVRPYNGTDYTYYGPADLTITENEDGTVDYNFQLRDDLVFSDGEKLTADDVIFSMYVLSDPTYDGNSTFFALPIEGMAEYREGMAPLRSVIFDAGEDNADFTLFTEEQQKAFWEKYNAATLGLAQEIVDYLVASGDVEEGNISAAAAGWGFEVAEGGTIEDFAAALKDAYGSDVSGMINTENAGSTVDDLFPGLEEFSVGVQTGDSAPSITGITKVSDTEVNVKLTEVDATAIYQLGLAIAPMHYYGDKAKYDYDNNMFGFDKGDLSSVRAVTTKPMGAGPYKFVGFENGVVSFEANESYYKGAPKTKYIQFRETSDPDKVNAVVTGTIDMSDPSFSDDKIAEIKQANGGELDGSVITTITNDTLGYGYLGIGADQVNVNGELGSEASKNLRKGFATIFAVYRDVTVNSYYGDRAAVINYPISNTSWAAPQKTDADYKVAFSTKLDGTDIYTSDMDDEARYAAAAAAALEYFEAAGCTVADGKVTAGPDGKPLEYEVGIGGSGSGDHPSFMMLTLAKEAFEKIGVNLIIGDYADWSEMLNKQKSRQLPMFCMAWSASVDPDMYQIYYSDVANGGANAGGSNMTSYAIADEELDQLIMDARKSLDQSYRKRLYKAALDIVVDWAVEIPVYQRQDCTVFSTERINIDTITPDITTFYGWMAEIENTELN